MFNIIEKSEVKNVIGGLLGKETVSSNAEKRKSNKGNHEKPGKGK